MTRRHYKKQDYTATRMTPSQQLDMLTDAFISICIVHYTSASQGGVGS